MEQLEELMKALESQTETMKKFMEHQKELSEQLISLRTRVIRLENEVFKPLQ